MATGFFKDIKCCKTVIVKEGQGGVAVFVKKDFEVMEGTVRNSVGGHHTIGVNKWKGLEIIVEGIYGLSINSDRMSAEIF
jgi:hypothetical protein